MALRTSERYFLLSFERYFMLSSRPRISERHRQVKTIGLRSIRPPRHAVPCGYPADHIYRLSPPKLEEGEWQPLF